MVTKRYDLKAKEVWNVIDDFQNVNVYHPIVKTVEKLSENDRGLGAARRCKFYDGGSVVEKIISYEPGKSLKVKLTEFSMPLKAAIAGVVVSEVSENQTDVSIEMDFEPKWGLLGRLMTVVIIRPQMTRMFGLVLDCLAHYVRTGEEIGEEGVPIK